MNNPCERYVWEQPKQDIQPIAGCIDRGVTGRVLLSVYYNTWADVATAPTAIAVYTALTPSINEIIYNLNHDSQ